METILVSVDAHFFRFDGLFSTAYQRHSNSPVLEIGNQFTIHILFALSWVTRGTRFPGTVSDFGDQSPVKYKKTYFSPIFKVVTLLILMILRVEIGMFLVPMENSWKCPRFFFSGVWSPYTELIQT